MEGLLKTRWLLDCVFRSFSVCFFAGDFPFFLLGNFRRKWYTKAKKREKWRDR